MALMIDQARRKNLLTFARYTVEDEIEVIEILPLSDINKISLNEQEKICAT
jgi:hypothetical protein